MVESTAAAAKQVKITNYDDPVYAKFKNVLKGAEKVRITHSVSHFPFTHARTLLICHNMPLYLL